MIAHTGRIWEAASDDNARPVLMGVYFDAKAGTLTATDSYIMARVPCETEKGDESGLIPAEALKVANGKSLLVADGKATLKLSDGVRAWNLMEGKPPDFTKILAAAEKVEAPIGINADLLKRLSLALNNAEVSPLALHLVHPRKSIRVECREGVEGVEGIIMPVFVRTDGAPLPPKANTPDLTDDDKVIAGIKAAMALLDKRRGKRKAAQAFRETVSTPTA